MSPPFAPVNAPFQLVHTVNAALVPASTAPHNI